MWSPPSKPLAVALSRVHRVGCRETHRETPADLPSPEDLWRRVLVRLPGSPFKVHPGCGNSMFAWVAFIVIHDFFRCASEVGEGVQGTV